MGDIFAIGDIHGCFDQLSELMVRVLEEMNADRDTLVFLGDYIDRGPASVEVVEYLIRLRASLPNTVFLKGNHEEMLQNYLDGLDKHTYLINGGRKTLEGYLAHRDAEGRDGGPIPEEHLEFFLSLSDSYQTEKYIFVHAGLRPGVPPDQQVPADMLWIRDRFVRSDYDFGKQVVFGHTPFKTPLVQFNKIGIDTGAVYGNVLTCVRLPRTVFFYA
ncbi:metallophosphatase [Desulfonema ishimotonii]|uniref:Metallophosphatase n=1 Tax=Desulfonema ishimotonii TaxID=45657 RepID=A0A401G231_9BACT|nr:metallophosphoesterase family protein [Desulfonema ishimotonii]GBC63274.1 metallophosphatase [Desulfonema ishimotonii]